MEPESCPLCGTRPTLQAGQDASDALKTFREVHRCIARVNPNPRAKATHPRQ